MRWLRWVIIILALLNAGWMTFDGTRALIVGDYITPESGKYAGQLGPWANLVSSLGVEPRSILMKSVFAVYGLTWLAVLGCFIMRLPGTVSKMFIAAAGSLWYLPVGTASSLIQIVLLGLLAAKKKEPPAFYSPVVRWRR